MLHIVKQQVFGGCRRTGLAVEYGQRVGGEKASWQEIVVGGECLYFKGGISIYIACFEVCGVVKENICDCLEVCGSNNIIL